MFNHQQLDLEIAQCFLSNSRLTKDRELTAQGHSEFLRFGGEEFSVYVNKNTVVCAAKFTRFIILAGKITECRADDLLDTYVRYFPKHGVLKPLSVMGVCYQMVLGV